MKKRPTPRGAGYTVRVGGRKYLTASLLEEQVEAAQQQLMELLRQNEALKLREAMHLEALEITEAVLDKLGVVAKQPVRGTKEHAKWLEVVLLDMQALTLKQELQLTPVAATPQASLAPSAGAATASIQAASEATCSRSTCSSSAIAAGNAGSGVNSGHSSAATGDLPSGSRGRVTRLMGTLTPEEILQFKGLSVAEVAGRFKAAKNQLLQARLASFGAGLDDTPQLEHAVCTFARLCFLSYISNESRHCGLVGLNLETLEREAMPEQTFRIVVWRAQLLPHQIQGLCSAFRVFCQIEAALMQQRQQVVQQLQDILGPGLSGTAADAAAAADALPQASAAAAAAAAGQQAAAEARQSAVSAAAGAAACVTLAPAARACLQATMPAQPGMNTAGLLAQGPSSIPAFPPQAAALLAAGVPARLLSPQLQMLLEIRAKAATTAAETAAGTAAGAEAGTAAGTAGPKAGLGACPAAGSSSCTQKLPPGRSDMPSSAADMTCIPVSSSDSKGKGDCIGSSSGQQLRVPGDTLPDQADVISGGSSSGSSGGGGGSSSGGGSSGGGGGGSSGGSSSGADTPEHSALHMPEQTISAQELFAEGVLAVDASEQVEALLERFMRVGWSLKHNGRKVTTMFMNILSNAQYADITCAAWPYFLSPLCLCAHLAQEHPDL